MEGQFTVHRIYGHPENRVPVCHLAAILVLVSVLVLIVVLIAVLVVVLILVLVVILIAVLILVLVIHDSLPPLFYHGLAANIACPAFQDLSLALKIKLASRPARMAAVMPPAAAFSPPVKIPRNPSF